MRGGVRVGLMLAGVHADGLPCCSFFMGMHEGRQAGARVISRARARQRLEYAPRAQVGEKRHGPSAIRVNLSYCTNGPRFVPTALRAAVPPVESSQAIISAPGRIVGLS